MKRIALIVLVASMFLAPSSMAGSRWVISGWSAYSTGYLPAVDVILGWDPSWMSYNYDLYTRQALSSWATHSWSLMLINYTDYSELKGVIDIDFLPDFPLDAKTSAMSSECKSMCAYHFSKWGMADCMTGQEAYRDVLNCMGRQIDNTFNVENWTY